MSTWQCPVCLGTYQDPQPTGEPYYHVCPSYTPAAFAALPPATRQQLAPDLAGDATFDEIVRRLFSRAVPRANARNECIVPGFSYPPRMAGDLSPYPPAPRIQDQPARIDVSA